MKPGSKVKLSECGFQDEVQDPNTGKKYLICDFSRGTVELMDAEQKKWAWPDCSIVVFLKAA